MADSKITALDNLTSADPANDMIPIVDVSATPPASGNTKRISINNILACSPTATLASATISGDLTVDTSTLKVDSANDAVGIGTATPASYSGSKLTVYTAGNTLLTIGQATSYANLQSNGYDFYINTNVSGANSNAGSFVIRHGSSSAVQYNIASGVHTWQNVGGVAGTAMTLNSTGLGVGIVPSGGAKLAIRDSGANDSYIGLGANNDIYLSTGASGVHYFRKAANAAAMTLDASGNLLVGVTSTTTPGVGNTTAGGSLNANGAAFFSNDSSQALYLNTNDDGQIVNIRRSNVAVGSISVTTTGTTFNSLSDYRLKEAVAPLSGGLARISALKPSVYKWKADGSNGEGFLAHELAEIVPLAVTGEKDAVNEDGSIKAQGVDLSKVVPVLVAAIQELTARVQTLETR